MRRSFPRQMASLEAIVAYVREFLAQEGLDEDAAADLDLVLEELFTNLVKYGRGARGDVEIVLERGPEGITARLTETNAEPFDPTALPEVDVSRPIAERRPGGLGVHFIRTLTKVFRYEYRDRTGVITVAMREPS
jgi:anti-sigma regulatory factor (Ser/Thr protein kinase)